MRLEVLDERVLLQHGEAFGLRHRVRRDVEVSAAFDAGDAYQVAALLRPLTFRILAATAFGSAGIVYSDDLMTMSGGPKPSRTPCHWLSVTSFLGGGRSFGSPCSAPPSTQRTIVSTCSSLSDMSFLNFCTPTLRSMCHGGICRAATRSRMERAHGRTSW